jgi:hypothetical protein
MRKYDISTIENYPDDGNHLECHISLPFDIKRGEDGYYYTDKKGIEHTYNLKDINNLNRKTDDRWIVHINGNAPGANRSLRDIFNIMVDKDLDKIVDYCFDIYEKSLELEKKKVEKIRKELGIIKKPKPQKTIGVIAYTIEDFDLWRNTKRHKPVKLQSGIRVYIFRGIRYVGLTQPKHVCGYAFDKLIETDRAYMNKEYYNIKKSAEIGLKTRKYDTANCN